MSKNTDVRKRTHHRSLSALDAIVLGTVNAPYKRSISAAELAYVLATGDAETWLVHVSTFFTDVRPGLLIDFAHAHGIRHLQLEAAYSLVKRATGERNIELEAALVALAQAA